VVVVLGIAVYTGISVAQPSRRGTAAGITSSGYCHDETERALSVRFTEGTAWRLCWRIDISAGLILSDVKYSPPHGPFISVLHYAGLAQIDVVYDDGRHEWQDLPGFGQLTARLRASDCIGGSKQLSYPGHTNVLCVGSGEGIRGAWSDYDFGSGNHTIRGSCAVLYTETPTDWYTYINQWRLCEDGSISGSVGSGGTLAPRLFSSPGIGAPIGPGQSRFATSHYHNVYWRLQFNLGGGQQSVVRADVHDDGDRRLTSFTRLGSETKSKSAESSTWEVLSQQANTDGHAYGYDLDFYNQHPYRTEKATHAFSNWDIYVTQYRQCERLASLNPTVHACASTVDRFVNGEALTSPVVWIQESFHHIPRDEDEPITDDHWLEFDLTPHGLTPSNLLPSR
jgi:primary-amine oxidase